MAGDWVETTWGELATLEYGKALQGYVQQPAAARVFGTNGPIGWHEQSLWKGPGVVIGRKGAYRGVHYSPSPYWVIDTAYSLQAKPGVRIHPRWAYYQVKHLDPNSIDDGSPIPSTTRPSFYAQPVSFPPHEEQERIADILGALDDKIALNRQIAETLEAMARALFRSWFVDFDPVHAKAEGRPTPLAGDLAALFPDGFGEDGLPEGWILSTVGDLFEVSGGNTPSTAEPENWDGRHQWATPKDLSGLAFPVLLQTERRISDVGLARSTSGLLPAGSLLLSSRAPIGYMAFASRPVAINQGFAGFVRRDVSTAYAWGWCTENMDVIRGNAGGSTFPEISKSVLRGLPMLKPPKAILASFDDAVAPIVARLIDAAEQSETLAALRDTLLPKLISGELRIRDAERAVAAA